MGQEATSQPAIRSARRRVAECLSAATISGGCLSCKSPTLRRFRPRRFVNLGSFAGPIRPVAKLAAVAVWR